MTRRQNLKWFAYALSFRAFVLACVFLSCLTIYFSPLSGLLLVLKQLDSISAALLAIPAVIFAVKVSLVTEIARGIMTPAYQNLARQNQEDPYGFVKSLNRSLTFFNLSSFGGVLVAFILNAAYGEANDPNKLSPTDCVAIKLGLITLLSAYLPIVWVIWKVHTNLSHYLTAISTPAGPDQVEKR